LAVLGLAQHQTRVKPGTVYHLNGITVVSPNQTGWELLQSTETELALQKKLDDAITNAGVKIFKTQVFDNDQDLLKGLEALKQEELNKLKRDSVHFNYINFKGSPCVQYDGLYTGDTAVPQFEHFNFKGYLCRYQDRKDMAVQAEFSNHSNRRGLSESALSLADEFFEKFALR